MWQTCTPFVSLFKGRVHKTRSREEYARPSRANEVVMGKAERCLRKHTRRTWLSACDHFGHTIWQHWHYGCSLCGISDRLYTLKVKVKNKWIYRTQKSPRAAANWAPGFKWHLWKQLVHALRRWLQQGVVTAGQYDQYETTGIHAPACWTKTYIILYTVTPMQVNLSPKCLF